METETGAADTARRPTERLTYRDATTADVEALVALVQSAYRGDSSRTGWTTEADILRGRRTDPRGVLEVIEAPGSRLIVVERGGALVACCQLEARGAGVAYFGMFAVRPGMQGDGIGRRVIADVERIAREELGAREMQMTVITVREELIAWYERRGYRRTGVETPFPYGDERFGVPTRDDLRFELLVKPLLPGDAAEAGGGAAVTR
ncbi:GNAT family N-acetyltransferase [Streptomyces sp. NRRL F-5126]|uniref:GNAT family N-acetyltransferase n=1 Tax=Streptomyces sp. NRRL F-5126 TaxID=1463857 RepID=UPI0004C5D284|nr:GNAT family N-acetyltransferase [Streptomyces sp. NRRL F-5126]